MWPGRLELLTVAGRDILLDGAHNPAGAAALAIALDDLRPYLVGGAVTLLTASMADKDVDGVVAALAATRSLGGATVICTSLPVPRALAAPDLASRWRVGLPGARVLVEPDPTAALDLAILSPTSETGPLVVAGSLYLVGAVRGRLIDDPALRDPDPAEDP